MEPPGHRGTLDSRRRDRLDSAGADHPHQGGVAGVRAVRPIRASAAIRRRVARAPGGSIRRAARRRPRDVAGLAPDARAAGVTWPASRAGPGDAVAAARIVGGSRPGPHRPDLARDGEAIHSGGGAVEGVPPRGDAAGCRAGPLLDDPLTRRARPGGAMGSYRHKALRPATLALLG